ncbi:MAG: hypothetical protein M0D55_03965 [Elusimicrobiota bacterium]|nr:MAG: hypothetical protein M0D55_03965 [Elusimicrobiota bacterium]
MIALALASLLAAAVPARAGDSMTVKDAGGFDPAGRTIEFPDRFGWRSYEASFKFAIDDGGRLASSSRLDVVIARRGGGSGSTRAARPPTNSRPASCRWADARPSSPSAA